MSVNEELLRTTLAYVREHPETWKQDAWRNESTCGTSYCFAGWAVTLANLEWHVPKFGRALVDVDGELHSPGVVARDALGLSTEQAQGLFAYWNTLDVLEHGVKLILDGWDGEELWAELATSFNSALADDDDDLKCAATRYALVSL